MTVCATEMWKNGCDHAALSSAATCLDEVSRPARPDRTSPPMPARRAMAAGRGQTGAGRAAEKPMAEQRFCAGDVGLATDEFDHRQIIEIDLRAIDVASSATRLKNNGAREFWLKRTATQPCALHEGFEAEDAAEHGHPVTAQPDDVAHARHLERRLLDVKTVVDLGEARHQCRPEIDVGRRWIIVNHDWQRDRIGHRLVVMDEFVIGRRRIERWNDHHAVGAHFSARRLRRTTSRVSSAPVPINTGTHDPRRGRSPSRRPEPSRHRRATGTRRSSRADQPVDPLLDLPFDKVPQRRGIDVAGRRERRNHDGVGTAKCLHRGTSNGSGEPAQGPTRGPAP